MGGHRETCSPLQAENIPGRKVQFEAGVRGRTVPGPRDPGVGGVDGVGGHWGVSPSFLWREEAHPGSSGKTLPPGLCDLPEVTQPL